MLRDQLRRKTRRPATICVLKAAYDEIKVHCGGHCFFFVLNIKYFSYCPVYMNAKIVYLRDC